MTNRELEIRQVYEADRRHPYYSIQSGRKQSAETQAKRMASRWLWGYFQEALRKALELRDAKAI